MSRRSKIDIAETDNWYVYALIRPNGEIFYIGMGIGGRWLDHEREAMKLKEADRRSHKENIILGILADGGMVERIKLREGLTREDAISTEVALIDAIGRWPNGPLANLTAGGEGLWDPPEEVRQKISDAHKGKQWKLGYKLTDEQKARQWFRDPDKNKAAALKRMGSKRTQEQRTTMALAQQNNTLAGQHRVGFKEDADTTARRLALAKAGIAANPTIWITNGSETRKHPIADPMLDGFQKGRTFSAAHKEAVRAGNAIKSDEAKANMRAARLRFLEENPERHEEIVAAKRTWEWYTNGTEQQQVAEGETPPDGWRLGMAISRKGVKWVTNGTEGRRIPIGEPPPDGWWFGFPPTKRHPDRIVVPQDSLFPTQDLELFPD